MGRSATPPSPWEGREGPAKARRRSAQAGALNSRECRRAPGDIRPNRGFSDQSNDQLKGSTIQATYIHRNAPSSSHFGSGFGAVCTLLMASYINYARFRYCASGFPLHSFVALPTHLM
jgi:hypothetical protein